MPDLPTISGGPGASASVPGSSTGVTVTSGNANADGAWTELISSNPYTTDWFLVTISGPVSQAATFLCDIGIGASTQEVELISDLFHHAPSTTQPNPRIFLFPVRIAHGTRIAARTRSDAIGASFRLTAQTIASGIAASPGCGRVETIGATPASSRGTTVDAGGTAHTDVIGQLVATTAFAYRWMCLSIANPGDIVWAANQTFLIDVMTGPGGSEVPVIEDLFVSGSNIWDAPQPGCYCFPCAIASGSRVAVRVRCSGTTAGDRALDYVAYGVG